MKTAIRGQAAPTVGSSRRISFQAIELCLGILVSLLIVALNVRFVCTVGGLWRDEVASVNLAKMPTYMDVWRHNWDSFPIIWITLLHSWIYFGPGDSDTALRLFGLLTGLAILAAYWLSVRRCGVNVPWVLLVCFGLNPCVVIFGSEVRGYGLGVITELGMLAAFWWFAQQPTPRRALVAAVMGVLSVQSLYNNCSMLAAAGIGWGIVFLWQRQWKALGLMIAVCAVAALSVVPYYFTYLGHREWIDIDQTTVSLDQLWQNVLLTLDSSGITMDHVWPAILIGMVAAGCWQLIKKATHNLDKANTVWCMISILLSLAFHLAFMMFLSVGGSFWYVFPVLVFQLFCIELLLERLVVQNLMRRALLVGIALLLTLYLTPHVWWAVHCRLTSIDLIAEVLEGNEEKKQRPLADREDLIVVWPWSYACVFHRYYHGPTAWIGLPDIDDKRWEHPRDFRRKMTQPDPIQRETDLVVRTLQSGGRVWLVLGPDRTRIKEVLDLPPHPMPDKPALWNQLTYSENWKRQLDLELQGHSASIQETVGFEPPGVLILVFERARLFAAKQHASKGTGEHR